MHKEIQQCTKYLLLTNNVLTIHARGNLGSLASSCFEIKVGTEFTNMRLAGLRQSRQTV